jgi:hypothetical protein
MRGLARLKRALTMLSRDTPIAQVPFASLGIEVGAIVAPNLTQKEAETLLCALAQLRGDKRYAALPR